MKLLKTITYSLLARLLSSSALLAFSEYQVPLTERDAGTPIFVPENAQIFLHLTNDDTDKQTYTYWREARQSQGFWVNEQGADGGISQDINTYFDCSPMAPSLWAGNLAQLPIRAC